MKHNLIVAAVCFIVGGMFWHAGYTIGAIIVGGMGGVGFTGVALFAHYLDRQYPD